MIKKAHVNDAAAIQRLIQVYADKGQMLFRSLEDIVRNIHSFFIYKKKGVVLGVCALNNSWDKAQMEEDGFKSDRTFGSLVEVRSLAVHPDHWRTGIGTALVTRCIEEAMAMAKEGIFVLTYAVSMFNRLGFQVISKSELPEKVWSDCRGCSKRDDCDETAMIRFLRVKLHRKTGNPSPKRKKVRLHMAS